MTPPATTVEAGEAPLPSQRARDEDDAMEQELERRRRRLMRRYKIQEVIRRRQIMLVQVVKEERGNKGAALTTYLSASPAATAVLMPNTARGGGISRKIDNSSRSQAPEGGRAVARRADRHGPDRAHRRRRAHQD